jgi:hypothetical protein
MAHPLLRKSILEKIWVDYIVMQNTYVVDATDKAN